MEGQMQLSGQLSDWSINDLLQIMQVTNRTGSLDIEGNQRGRVHFRDGRVTGAELSGPNGGYIGSGRSGVADVLYVLSRSDEGSFAVGAADGPDVEGWSVEEVVSDVDDLRALESEVVDSGLFEASGVRLVQKIEEPMTVEPEDWHILVTLVRPFTFDYLESQYGRGTAVRIFHTLDRLGMAEAIAAGDGETEWLDRLAEDVSPGSGEPTWLEDLEKKASEDPELTGSADEALVAVTDRADEESGEVEPADEEPLVVIEPESSEKPDAGKKPTRKRRVSADVQGVSAPASTTLTDGVYDEIRRLRSKVSEK